MIQSLEDKLKQIWNRLEQGKKFVLKITREAFLSFSILNPNEASNKKKKMPIILVKVDKLLVIFKLYFLFLIDSQPFSIKKFTA